MSVLVVGSVAFDTIETPKERRERVLGGAANYFSITASMFSPIQLVAVVGEDFPQAHIDELQKRNIDTKGLQRVVGKTFHWAGRYGEDCNDRVTLATDLNVFADFKPILPADYRKTEIVFLANIQPTLQLNVLEQMQSPRFVAADTMNLWIDTAPAQLKEVMKRVDCLLINEGEARMLAGENNIVRAGKAVNKMGPRIVVVKLGAYGALLFVEEEIRFVPAFPLHQVVDPTGAGDTFAGGFMGYLAKSDRFDLDNLHKAAAIGSVMGAYCCEDFGPTRLLQVTSNEIEQRLAQLSALQHFDMSSPFA